MVMSKAGEKTFGNERYTFEEAITMQCPALYVLREMYRLKVKDMESLIGLHYSNFNTMERGDESSRVALKEAYTQVMELHAFILTGISAKASEYYLNHCYELFGGKWYEKVLQVKEGKQLDKLEHTCKEYQCWICRLAVCMGISLEYNLGLEDLLQHKEAFAAFKESKAYRAVYERFEYNVKQYQERPYYITQAAMKNLISVLEVCMDKRKKKQLEIHELLRELN